MKRRTYEGRGDRYGNVKRRRRYTPQRRNQPSNQQITMLRKRIQEKKGLDTRFTGNIVSTTNDNTDIYPLNLVQMGNGSWNRIGKAITMESLRITGSFKMTATDSAITTNTLSNNLRMIVVYDKQPSGNAIPSFDTIFGRTDQTGTENTEYLDPLRYDNVGRFTVIRDKVINMKATSMAGDNNQFLYYCDEYIKLRNLETIYKGQSDPMTIADISSGALYLIFRTETNSTGFNVVSFSRIGARLRYFD